MFEEDGVSGTEIDFGGGYDFALYLAGACAEVDLRHVADAGRFAPSGVADNIADVERRATCGAGRRRLLVHALTPLALDSFKGCGCLRGCDVVDHEAFLAVSFVMRCADELYSAASSRR